MNQNRLWVIFVSVLLLSACAPAASHTTVGASETRTLPPTALVATPTISSSQQDITEPRREPLPTPTITVTPPPLPLPADTACRADAAQAADLGRLAYVQGGDIWVKSLPDGKSLRLTTDGHNREPRWSPSGQWIAFRKGDEVWIVSTDGGTARQVATSTPTGFFAWSPKADQLAYITENRALVVENADGSNRHTLAASGSDEQGTGVWSMAWSPDGAWLAFSREEILKQAQPPDRYASLWRIRADGSGAQELVNAGRPSEFGLYVAGWSSDSHYVLFWIAPMFSASIMADGVPLMAVPAQGGAQKELAKSVLVYPDFVVPHPGKTEQIAVIVGGYRSVWTNKALHVLSIIGEDIMLTPSDMSASSPDWSPDGQRLAYVAMPDRGDPAYGLDADPSQMPRRLFVVNAQGAPQPRQLTDDPTCRDEWPRWSPDGKRLLFVRVDARKQASVWLISAQGGAPCWVVDQLSQETDTRTYYISPRQMSDLGWMLFPYYGHMDWSALLDWWRGPGASRP